MTSKERAAYRAQANSLEPLFQIGKGACGIGDQMAAAERALIAELDGILRRHGRVARGVMFQNFGHWYVLFLIGLCSNDITFFPL